MGKFSLNQTTNKNFKRASLGTKKFIKRGAKKPKMSDSPIKCENNVDDTLNKLGLGQNVNLPKIEKIKDDDEVGGLLPCPPESQTIENVIKRQIENPVFIEVPNNRVKAYVGPGFKEEDVIRIFGKFGEIKSFKILEPARQGIPPTSCIVSYININDAKTAKEELHQSTHLEFTAKISVTFVKKQDPVQKRMLNQKRNQQKHAKTFGFSKNSNFEQKDKIDSEVKGRTIVSYADDDLFD